MWPDVARWGAKGGACIEADIGRADHERVAGEARVKLCIEHHQQVVAFQCVRAEGNVAWGAALLQAQARNEQLVGFPHQRDQCDGSLEAARCCACDLLKAWVRLRIVQAILRNRSQPGAFVCTNLRSSHTHTSTRWLRR